MERNSELNATHVAVRRVKADLLSSSKSQAREVKRLKKLVDDQQEKKLRHELEIQEMRIKVKQLALEETRERSSKASAAPKTARKSQAMGLDDKKELATHNALLKKQQKENDDARAALKKDLKKKETQSNLGFAAGMLQNTSNMNGGMWQSTSVAEVSFDWFCLLLLLFSTNIIYLQSFNQLIANNKQVAAANSTNSNVGIADAMRQTTLTQCFNPPRPAATTTLPDGYSTFVIDGTKYLLNDTTNHLIIVPTPPAAASVTAQSITPVDLSKKSFVTPSVTKASKKKRPSSSSSIVLAEHQHGDSCCASDDSSIVYVRAKKKKARTNNENENKNKKNPILDLVVSSANSSSLDDDEVTVLENPAVAATLEVETQLLPQTEDFGQSKVAQEDDENIGNEDENISVLSPNLLEDDDDE